MNRKTNPALYISKCNTTAKRARANQSRDKAKKDRIIVVAVTCCLTAAREKKQRHVERKDTLIVKDETNLICIE